MDDLSLLELLECPVCFEKLDASAKVLPCQHTFCQRCLQRILKAQKELRCPECRTLVLGSLEQLPSNLLLIRLLDGVRCGQSAPRLGSGHRPGVLSSPASLRRVPRGLQLHQHRLGTGPRPHMEGVPRARALYTYRGHNPGELRFNKGDTIVLLRQLDENWYLGELNGSSGVFPASSVQVIKHLPLPRPLFSLDLRGRDRGDSKDILTLQKVRDILTLQKVQDTGDRGSGQRAAPRASRASPGALGCPIPAPALPHLCPIPAPSQPQLCPIPAPSLPHLSPSLSLPRCVALHPYTAHGPDELELQKGEGVRVFGKEQDGWLRGMSLLTGRVGLFPGNYVAPLFRKSSLSDSKMPSLYTSWTLSTASLSSQGSVSEAGPRQSRSRSPSVCSSVILEPREPPGRSEAPPKPPASAPPSILVKPENSRNGAEKVRPEPPEHPLEPAGSAKITRARTPRASPGPAKITTANPPQHPLEPAGSPKI
uniref:SH3 domain containing ring finger 2 n=1 Tax=Zosterops lateralis melanops TaxID=1220523 RepID=A0A8D2NL06_ZOSLA